MEVVSKLKDRLSSLDRFEAVKEFKRAPLMCASLFAASAMALYSAFGFVANVNHLGQSIDTLEQTVEQFGHHQTSVTSTVQLNEP